MKIIRDAICFSRPHKFPLIKRIMSCCSAVQACSVYSLLKLHVMLESFPIEFAYSRFVKIGFVVGNSGDIRS